MHRTPQAQAETQPVRHLFSGFSLEPDGRLWRGETTHLLSTEEAAVLRLLLERAGEIVSPLELKRAAWRGEPATSDAVAKCVAGLRLRLHPVDCIQYIYKRGYRISTPVHSAVDSKPGVWPRLAILPFTVGFGVPEYLGPAISELAAAQLSGAKFAAVTTVARDSIATLTRRAIAPLEIGKMLDADLVLTGALLATPERMRLRVEVIRVADGAQLWVDDLLVKSGRIAQLESELVHRLSSRVYSDGLYITAFAAADAGDQDSLPRSEAHELYLRAHQEWQSLERHHMQDASARLQRAIELDPSLIPARADLSHLCVAQAICGFLPPTVAAGIVRKASRIPFAAGNADALLAPLGWIRFHIDRNLGAALSAFARSAHFPHDPWITRLRTSFLLSRRKFDEALDGLDAAIQIDPYSPWLQTELAWALHLAGRSEESVNQVRKAVSQFTEHEGAHLYGAMILAWNGEAARAVELARALTARSAHFDAATSVYAYALSCAGRKEEARTVLERLRWLGRERFVMNTFDAATYVAMEEDDAAIEELHIANARRCPWFFQSLADPRLQPLHGRPEFEKMRGILRAMESAAESGDDGEETGLAAMQAG